MSDIKREKLVESFGTYALRYKDSILYAKSERSTAKRVFHGLRKFNFSYVWYQFSRLKVPGLFWNIKITLFFGRELILPASDVGANVFCMYGILPDKSERKLTLWMIKNMKDRDVFYDVGAHLGYYSAISEKILSKGETHAFEANPKLCEYLKRNFYDSKNVRVCCAAVADSVGEIGFYDTTKTGDSSASSRFRISGLHATVSKVSATTLDNYVREGNNPPTIIKMDIEGGECDAINGALGIIRKHGPSILMEIWGGEIGEKYSGKAVKKLQELGYKAFALRSNGSVSLRPVDDPVKSISSSLNSTRDNFLFLK